MKKTLRYLLLAVLTTMFGAAQAQVNITASELAGNPSENTEFTSGTAKGFTFEAQKNNGNTAPTYNAKSKDLRIYAKGTLKVSAAEGAITKIVFNISTQGKKRLAPITASTGTIASQAAGDETVTWTGSASSVTFTVGDNANYGSDGESKAGQLDFDSADIYTGDPQPTDPNSAFFDFTEDDYGMPHSVSGESSADDYLEDGTTFSSGNVTATITGNNPARYWETAEGVTELRLYRAGTLTLSVPYGKVIKKVVFTGTTISGICAPDGKTLTNGTWEGQLNEPAFTFTGTQKINTITVTLDTGSDIPIEVTYTDMTMSEATAKSLEGTAMKNINLKLNNALVVYDFVKGNNEGFFVREGDYAIEFYNTGLGLKAGQTITGSIKCNLSPFNYTPEVVKADDASVTNLDDVTLGTGTVTPTEMTADEAYNGETHLGDLVVVKEAPVVTEENKDTGALMYYVQSSTELTDKDGNFTGYGTVRIYDYFFNGSYTFPEIPATYVPTFDIKAIYVANSKTTRRLWVLDMKTPGQEDEATAIQAVTTEQTDGAIYNLQGQRISQPARGLYIQNGRKYIAK